MGEVVNIATLALSASEKVFSTFGWDICDVKDENFPCLNPKSHELLSKGKTHPLDCVFAYNDPFTNRRLYLLCDLKSYSSKVANDTKYGKYIQGLAKAAQCAQVGEVWKDRYVEPGVDDFSVDGFLFVYNHDAKYHKDFIKEAKGLAPASLKGSRESRVHLIGADRIAKLQSISADIKSRCGENDWVFQSRRFFYPQQTLRMPGNSLLDCANIEMLRGRRIIVRLLDRSDNPKSFYLVYCESEGDTESLEYLITYLYRNRIVEGSENILIVGIGMSPEAQSNLDKAKKQFLERHYGMLEISRSLAKIDLTRLAIISESFCSMDEAKLRK